MASKQQNKITLAFCISLEETFFRENVPHKVERNTATLTTDDVQPFRFLFVQRWLMYEEITANTVKLRKSNHAEQPERLLGTIRRRSEPWLVHFQHI